MSRKKLLAIIAASLIAIFILALVCGIWWFHQNAIIGRNMYLYSAYLSTSCDSLARAIRFLQGEYAQVEEGERVYTNALETAIAHMRSSLGPSAAVLSNEVVLDYHSKTMELREWTQNEKSTKEAFADPERAQEIECFRVQLELLVIKLQEFRDYYGTMSEWERYTTSWEDVRAELCEAVRIP